MRLHATTAGLDAAALEPGADLVLEIAAPDAPATAHGVGADDHLDVAARRAADAAACDVLGGWRARHDGPLTVDGVCLPFVAELRLMAATVAAVRRGEALRAALAAHAPRTLEVVGGDPFALGLARAVGAQAGIEVVADATGRRTTEPAGGRPTPLRQRLLAAALELGPPSVLRRDSVLVLSYWPLMPLLDRLLATPGLRPAVSLQQRPTGPRRTLAAAAQGGWTGHAGVLATRRAAPAVQAAVRAARSGPPPRLDGTDWDVGACLHDTLLDVVAAGGAHQIAMVRMLRRAFRRSPPRLVLGAFDTEPEARIVFAVAREAGVPTFVLAHGAFLMPQTIADMDMADEAAVWSRHVAPPGMRGDRPVHEVGYPVDATPAAADRPPPGPAPRIVVLGQNGHPYTAMFDDRVVIRHYEVALRALREAVPGARITLRPHPSQPLAPLTEVLRREAMEATIDIETPILELLAAADLCVGSLTTATLEAALPGTPLIALNVTGYEWPWPFGGDTPVPVAQSPDALEQELRRWRSGALPAGREALLEALGADRPGATERLLALTRAAGQPR